MAHEAQVDLGPSADSPVTREKGIVGVGVGLPTVQELELWILGAYYGILTQGVDRGSDELLAPNPDGEGFVSTVEPISGLTARPGFRKPVYNALTGEALARASRLDFFHWACAFLGRRDEGTGRVVTLDMVHRDEWAASEKERHAVLECRMKQSVMRMAERGLFDVHPVWGPDGERLPLGDDGLPAGATITHRGVEEAKRRVPGTRFESRPVSKLETAPDRIRAAAPIEFLQEWLRERRGGMGVVNL